MILQSLWAQEFQPDSLSCCRLYSDGLGVWFMTYCCCLVEFGSSCFNHAWIESWFVWFGPWYTTWANFKQKWASLCPPPFKGQSPCCKYIFILIILILFKYCLTVLFTIKLFETKHAYTTVLNHIYITENILHHIKIKTQLISLFYLRLYVKSKSTPTLL